MSLDLNSPEFRKLLWPLRLTRLGMFAEQCVRAFWPFWTLLLVLAAAVLFEAHQLVPPVHQWAVWAGIGLFLLILFVHGLRRFDPPSKADAMVRLDASLPGQPITTALDEQAIGADDEASRAVWQAHVARVKKRLDAARAVSPDLRVSNRDTYGLRYIALMIFTVALGFGTLLRNGSLSDLTDGVGGAALATGPSWEMWVEPPRYTGKPTIYLNEVSQETVEVPKGSTLTVRLYGQLGSLELTETVSGQEADPEAEPETAFSVPIVQSGEVAVAGGMDRAWNITALEDASPTVAQAGEIDRSPDGEMRLTFSGADDYGVVSGTAEITLDLASVDRRYGLTRDPEARETITLDLPMPISGNRAEFTETMIENLAKHPWANLPVEINLIVRDAADQDSDAAVIEAPLPGRRFFQPVAKAVIEQRRDLLWSRENAKQVDQILRTITHAPDDYFTNKKAFLALRRAITRLELVQENGLEDAEIDEISEMLWEAALTLEEGSLEDARERLRRAQERLSDAMRDGATDEEIAELMQELSEAMDQYMQQLAQEQERNGEQQQQAQNGESMELSDDTIQQMLDEIQRMMEEGDMEGAERLLAQLMEMMENLQIAEGQPGQGGQGQQGQGQQSMEDLQETLRNQQGLSDEAFRDLQEQLNPNAQAGESEGNEGRNGGQGRGEQHEGEGGEGQAENQGEGQDGEQEGQQNGQGGNQQAENQGGSLADRQEDLRRELNRQSQNVPGAGTPEGDAARDALRRADEAMNRAEDALRNDQMADALGAQSDAMEALREGIRNLGDAQAQNQQQQQGGENGQANSDGQSRQRDPLGREPGSNGTIGSEGEIQGELDARRRSRDLLDEIRRRSGEQDRPDVEREYLERLLDQF